MLTYRFTGRDALSAGYAEGAVTVSPPDGRQDGVYALYWADDAAILPDWGAVAVVTAGECPADVPIPRHLLIPPAATRLVLCGLAAASDEPTAPIAAVPIPPHKRFCEPLRYTYALCADAHIGCPNDYTPACAAYFEQVVRPSGGTDNAAYNFSRAMRYYAATDAAFMLFGGDLTDHGRPEEYRRFYDIVAASGFDRPVWAVNGNHDALTDFTARTGNPALYYETAWDGDHYLMLGMEHQNARSEGVLSPAQLDWLEERLVRYDGDGHGLFVLFHPHIGGYTPGDACPPTHGTPLDPDAPAVRRLIGLLEAHPRTVLFSPHTHLILECGSHCGDRGGTTARMVHLPAIGASKTRMTDLWTADGVDQRYAEGYLVRVYRHHAAFCGVDLLTGRMLAQASYILPL